MGRVNLSHPEEEAITQKRHKVKECIISRARAVFCCKIIHIDYYVNH